MAAKKKAARKVAKPAKVAKNVSKATKKKAVKPIPPGYHVVTAYLCIDGAAAAIDFYKRVFGAKERMRMDAPGGKVGHAEILIGDSVVMLADQFPEMNFYGPKSGGNTSINMHLYMKDVDAVVKRAVVAGAKVVRPVEDKFYGDRTGSIEDPFGHVWHIATHTEDLSMAEMKRRGEAAAKQSGG
jgi:PhnB protein